MGSPRSDTVPTWLRSTLWALAGLITVVGVVVASATASFWPLIAIAGLAIPLMPLRSRRPGQTRPNLS